MKKTTKIILITTPILILGAYFFVYRNRVPNLEILPNINWGSKTLSVKFGNTTKVLTNSSGVLNAGKFHSEKYMLYYQKDDGIMVLEVRSKMGKIVKKITIDFRSKLIY